MDFFCDVVLWFMLLIGLILMLLPSSLVRLDLTDGGRIPGGAEYAGKGAGGGRSNRHRTYVRTQQ